MKRSIPLYHNDIKGALQRLVTCVRDTKFERIMLAHYPMHTPKSVSLRTEPMALLREVETEQSPLFLQQWKDEGFHSIRFPYVLCALEGPVDIRIGVTRSMWAAAGTENEPVMQIISMPSPSILVIPPGVPYPNGNYLHWERPGPPANSRILWLHLLPGGIRCHTCATVAGEHSTTSTLFFPDAEAAHLTRLFMVELKQSSEGVEHYSRELMLFLLGRLQRQIVMRSYTLLLSRGHGDHEELEPFSHSSAPVMNAPRLDSDKPVTPPSPDSLPSPPLRRACVYIREHSAQPITLSQIAAHAFISPSHLVCLFRTEMNTTAMRYLAQCRFERAQSLLENTRLPIHEIARLVGIADPAHFTRAFKLWCHLTPREYRRRYSKVLCFVDLNHIRQL